MAWQRLKQPTQDESRDLDYAYPGKGRFLVDESMGATVAEIVRQRGFNAKFVSEFGLIGHSDEDVLAAAWAERRIILTHDSDFMDDRRFPPHRNAGIVVIHPGADGPDNGRLLTCLIKTLLIAGKNAKWFYHRKLEFSSDEEFTIRSHKNGKRMNNRYLWPNNGYAMEWVEGSDMSVAHKQRGRHQARNRPED